MQKQELPEYNFNKDYTTVSILLMGILMVSSIVFGVVFSVNEWNMKIYWFSFGALFLGVAIHYIRASGRELAARLEYNRWYEKEVSRLEGNVLMEALLDDRVSGIQYQIIRRYLQGLK